MRVQLSLTIVEDYSLARRRTATTTVCSIDKLSNRRPRSGRITEHLLTICFGETGSLNRLGIENTTIQTSGASSVERGYIGFPIRESHAEERLYLVTSSRWGSDSDIEVGWSMLSGP